MNYKPVNYQATGLCLRTFTLLLGFSLLLLALLAPAYAVPNAFTVQGRLTNDSNTVVTGSYNFTFHFFDSQTGGSHLWSETHNSTSVINGLFNVTIGDTNTNKYLRELDFNATKWLQIEVNGETQTPRLKITSTASAITADTAKDLNSTGDNNATNLGISGNLFANNVLLTGDSNFANIGVSGYSFLYNTSVLGDINASGAIKGLRFLSYNATSAGGEDAVAFGNSTRATGAKSSAFGWSTTASGTSSTAMGQTTTAGGDQSTAMGVNSQANGAYSVAMGQNALANGMSSIAMGGSTTASGHYSTASGLWTLASGESSTALGYNTTASGVGSIAMGVGSQATESGAIAIGSYVVNSDANSVVLGRDVNVAGDLNVTKNLLVWNDLNVVGDANFGGSVQATGFYGDGSGLTGISAGLAWADVNAHMVPYIGADYNVTLGTYSLTATEFTGDLINLKDATIKGNTAAGGWMSFDAYPNTGNNIFNWRVHPSGTQDQSVLTFFNAEDMANAGLLRLQIDGAKALILTSVNGGGTEPQLGFQSTYPFGFNKAVDVDGNLMVSGDANFANTGAADAYVTDVVLGSAGERLVYPKFYVGGTGNDSTRTLTVQFADYGDTNVSKNIAYTWWLATTSMGTTNPSNMNPPTDGGNGALVADYGNTTYNDYTYLALTNSSGSSQISLGVATDQTVYFHAINPTDGKVYSQGVAMMGIPP